MSIATLEISDMQKNYKIRNIPDDVTIGELIHASVRKMNLPVRDSNGAPINFKAFHERERRHLTNSEVVGTVLKDDDRLVFEPDIEAGISAMSR